MSLNPEAIRPTSFREIEGREIFVTWQDGHQSLYAFSYLRKKCRCAACVDEWTGEMRLSPDKISEAVKSLATRAVGNYGVRFDWSDGHNTGIYSFDYLRSLCPCAVCGGKE